MKRIFLAVLFSILLLTTGYASTASAQFQAGGVSKQGSWYVGEGLKKGNFFSYSLCHIDYKDCSQFRIDFWIESDQKVGSEDQWKVQTVVYDGAQIIKGTMYLGKIAPEPTGGTDNLTPYRAAFKSSIAWLSAYATADTGSLTGKGPKNFNAPSWGKIGNIGGEQIIPTAEEKIAVPDGIFDTVQISWKTGGKINRVWVVDEFPFPIKADTYAHVAEGVPPQEYRFELLDYQQNIVNDPFVGIKDTASLKTQLGCETNYSLSSVAKNTNTNSMIVELKYGPNKPKHGCDLELIINFKRSVNQEEFENQVHYDILVVEQTPDGLSPTRSIADEEKRNTLFTTSGQVRRIIEVKESGPTKYAIFVYGTGPETTQPNAAKAGFITFDVQVQGESQVTPPPPPPPPPQVQIPAWIKNNAKWWADGTIGDNDFVSGIQYLINQKIIKIPPTTPGSSSTTNVIPAWIKNNAKWWADGTIGDNDFVSGIQYLITNGIIKITS
ncbi:peptidase [Candidatus Nitrosotenuis uzonensis]|uniref:peptidase n=1 Tax=Candidatus Nitrosotenuis uzonensis TaxID=1407055 RepID=UPI001EF9E541|nr:peptidase [Candidatus Nitrosotenuis uzonensis]